MVWADPNTAANQLETSVASSAPAAGLGTEDVEMSLTQESAIFSQWFGGADYIVLLLSLFRI